MTEEFFRALAHNAGLTLHIKIEYGKNDHHKTEACFKAVAHALRIATEKKGSGFLSTKGII
jgi:imidazoleglycerol-phosphate dehydratase